MKKRLIALTVAAMCAVGSINTVFGATFADINDVPWSGAETYINEAASLGLMAGYEENGQKLFKAKNNVTYCEAVQMIYSIMCTYSSENKASDTVISKWTSTMQSANIPSWAYECVAYGLENGILSTSDISIFMSSSTEQRDAKREDVGVIFGKALSKLYSVNSSATLSFGDASSFSSSSVPYIDLLYRLGLMVGDDSNNFNPKNNINRAEMAVLSTKTYNKLQNVGSDTTESGTTTTTTTNNEQVVGTVTDVSDDSITVDVDGTERTITVSDSTTIIYNGDSGELSDINASDIAVISVINGVAMYISDYPVYGTTSSSSITKGTITSISTTRITIEQDSKKATYKFDDDYNDVTLTLDSKKTSDIDDLIELVNDGYNIQATITANSSNYVTKIVATTITNSLEGEVTNVTSSKITINNGSTTYAYNLPDDTDDITVTIDGSSSDYDAFKELYNDGETITVKLSINSSKEITKIVAITEASTSTISGTITSLTSSTIKIKTSSGSSKSYSISSNVTVTVDGSSSSVSKLISKVDDDDYEVTLTISDSKATKIVATLVTEEIGGQIKSLDDDEIKIKYDGSTKTYDLSSSVKVTIDGNTRLLSTAISNYGSGSTSTTWAYLTLNSSGLVTRIDIDTDVEEADDTEGTIKSISADDKEIKIKLSDGTTKTYDLASNCKVTIDGSSSTVSKLEDKIDDGESYEVELTVSSSKVTKIKATSSKGEVSGTIISLNVSNKTIKLGTKSSSGVYIGNTYTLASSCKAVVDGDKTDMDDFEDLVLLNTYTATLTRNSNNEVTKITATKK